ncbi:MAG: N-6 DNA methylase [Caulobacteraceae bacterium]|nr:N-6 DNA methylase [Caulobacteraceae bacterium]
MARAATLLRKLPPPSPEQTYSEAADPAHRKALGQYFTPATLAALMADWIAQINPMTVLDPAMGTGVLTRAVQDRIPEASITAYEKDQQILAFADVGTHVGTEIRHADFMRAPYSQRYDAVIMNPPYIRHRELPNYDNVRADLSVRCGYIVPKSVNLYIYFSIKSVLHLNPGGRASILIPSEWMNANFSSSFKRLLIENNILKEIILFSGCSVLFEDALTTASILLLEMPK